jgi:hypothetical protein
MANIENDKTKCNKNVISAVAPVAVELPEIEIPAKVIADILSCSPIYVKLIRQGNRPVNTTLAEKIEVTDQLLKDGAVRLIQDVKRTINNHL